MGKESVDLGRGDGPAEALPCKDRFAFSQAMRRSRPVDREDAIAQLCRGRRVLDLGCVRHDASCSVSDPLWLHRRIRDVAARVLGVDYLAGEVEKLRAQGYDMICGDVTRPLPITEVFDVVVAGDLVEHLGNLEAFFANCHRLLADGGILLISTPNPFFAGEFHYVAWKRSFLVNPEHTCWIDPLLLARLAGRWGFEMAWARYCSRSWRLPDLLCDSAGHEYDILLSRWNHDSAPRKVLRKAISMAGRALYPLFCFLTGAGTALVRHSDYLACLRKTAPGGPPAA
ncbi:MAG: methyltransferase domain-containing protein [Elusimicrobia bacterium]|nr:methyltransferase domain-containing protein [Elusimicrobiota bacterium]